MSRRAIIACAALAVIAAVVSRDARVVGGVLAGGALVGLAWWAITGLADALTGPVGGGENSEIPRVSRGFVLVKFFTRHVILALVAYVMMVRLHLDPVGMVVGVTSVVVAAVFEAARPR